MSLCLQSMVEELVRIRSGERDPMRLTRCTSNRHSKNKINGIKVKYLFVNEIIFLGRVGKIQ